MMFVISKHMFVINHLLTLRRFITNMCLLITNIIVPFLNLKLVVFYHAPVFQPMTMCAVGETLELCNKCLIYSFIVAVEVSNNIIEISLTKSNVSFNFLPMPKNLDTILLTFLNFTFY